MRNVLKRPGRRLFWLGIALGCAMASPCLAQIDTTDPSGDLGSLLGDPLGGGAPISISAQFTAPAAGQPSELLVSATMPPGWHIYSITQPKGGPIATTITVEASPDYRLAGPFVAGTAPQKKVEPLFGNITVETHAATITWRAPLEIRPGVNPRSLAIRGVVNAQPCDAGSCLPPQDFPFTASLGPGMAAAVASVPPADSSGTGGQEPIPWDPSQLKVNATDQALRTPVLLAMGMGFLGGLILNLMPCVLPVIGLKILSFVEQAGQSRRRALVLNLWYSLGLVSVFLVLASLAVFAGYGWGQLFQMRGFNITLAAVVFVMALSFLGVWEIPIPGFSGSSAMGRWAEREGVSGAFAKGVVTTILATPCGAPFLGSALAATVSQPPAVTYAIFGSAGLGMASPYLLLGAFPQLLRFLPKPGMWMETFKQIMGFVLLGTVVYILTYLAWPVVVPTIALLFGLWFSCWWVGRVPLTADSGTRRRAWIAAVAFGAIAWVIAFPGIDEIVSGRLAFGGLNDVMQGRFEWTLLTAPGSTFAARGESEPSSEDKLSWQPFSRARLGDLVGAGKTVLVDFTADWCLTCKTLEAQVLDTPPVRAMVRDNGVVLLKADWGKDGDDPEVTAMLELLGSKQVPVIAVFPAGNPNQPSVFRGGYTQTMLLEALRAAGPSREGPPGAAVPRQAGRGAGSTL